MVIGAVELDARYKMQGLACALRIGNENWMSELRYHFGGIRGGVCW